MYVQYLIDLDRVSKQSLYTNMSVQTVQYIHVHSRINIIQKFMTYVCESNSSTMYGKHNITKRNSLSRESKTIVLLEVNHLFGKGVLFFTFITIWLQILCIC